MPQCLEGDIRLVGGASPQEGVVEVCFDGIWNPICDNLWSVEDAQVACRQLELNTNCELNPSQHVSLCTCATGLNLSTDVNCNNNSSS